jgi:hypothetical protein
VYKRSLFDLEEIFYVNRDKAKKYMRTNEGYDRLFMGEITKMKENEKVNTP